MVWNAKMSYHRVSSVSGYRSMGRAKYHRGYDACISAILHYVAQRHDSDENREQEMSAKQRYLTRFTLENLLRFV
jgi:hypothetical protein